MLDGQLELINVGLEGPTLQTGHWEVAGLALPGPRLVETPPVAEPAVAVEHEDVRRTDGAVGARHFLRLVEEVRKRVALLSRAGSHRFERVLGVLRRVVGADGDEADAARRVRPRHRDHRRLDVAGVGAVVAREDDDERRRLRVVRQAARRAARQVDFRVGRAQFEAGRLGAQLDHVGVGNGHRYRGLWRRIADDAGSVTREGLFARPHGPRHGSLPHAPAL